MEVKCLTHSNEDWLIKQVWWRLKEVHEKCLIRKKKYSSCSLWDFIFLMYKIYTSYFLNPPVVQNINWVIHEGNRIMTKIYVPHQTLGCFLFWCESSWSARLPLSWQRVWCWCPATVAPQWLAHGPTMKFSRLSVFNNLQLLLIQFYCLSFTQKRHVCQIHPQILFFL